MNRLIVELIPDPELGRFTARVPRIPAYGEGETEDDAIADLKEALSAPSSLRHLDLRLEDLLVPKSGDL